VVCHVDSLQANQHLLPEPLIAKYYSEIVLDANSEMCAGCIFGGERRLGGKKCNLYKDGLEVTKEKPIHQRIREWVNSLHARMFLG
jgi:hypothetical protein